MPVLAPGASPYPLVSFIMNLARARTNDAQNDISGDLLANDQPYTLTFLNQAWRWLQTKLANTGVETAIHTAVIYNLPVTLTQDTALECFVNVKGCSDGTNEYNTPTLPEDIILPLEVGMRMSGTTNTFCKMESATGGLPHWFDPHVYDWRGDAMYYYGFQYQTDLKIRYSAFLPPLDLLDPLAVAPIMYCEDALAARVGLEYANSRGGAGATLLQQMSEDACNEIAVKTGRKNQRKSIRRQPYGGRGFSRRDQWL